MRYINLRLLTYLLTSWFFWLSELFTFRHVTSVAIELCTKIGSHICYSHWDRRPFVPDIYLMTSPELTSGFDFWSCDHLRIAVTYLPTKFSTKISEGRSKSLEPGYLRLNFWAKHVTGLSSKLLLVFLKNYIKSSTCLLNQIQYIENSWLDSMTDFNKIRYRLVTEFLSRVSILTRDIDIANLSVRLSVCLSVTFRYQMKTA